MTSIGGSQKGGVQKGGFGRCSPITRVHSDAPWYQKTERGYMRMFPGTKKSNEGTCTKTALLRNCPFVSSRLKNRFAQETTWNWKPEPFFQEPKTRNRTHSAATVSGTKTGTGTVLFPYKCTESCTETQRGTVETENRNRTNRSTCKP